MNADQARAMTEATIAKKSLMADKIRREGTRDQYYAPGGYGWRLLMGMIEDAAANGESKVELDFQIPKSTADRLRNPPHSFNVETGVRPGGWPMVDYTEISW